MKLANLFQQSKNLPSEPEPRYKGYVDATKGPVVRGWAMDRESTAPVTLKVSCGAETQYIEANAYREDIAKSGQHATGFCGFKVEFSANNYEVAKVEIFKQIQALPTSKLSFKNRQWFLLHLPKTAGTSFNAVMEKSLGDGKSQFHIEGFKQDLQPFMDHKFISGHVGYDFYKQHFANHNFVSLVFLRDPLKQLVSHINWVRHLDDIKETSFAQNHPASVLKLASKLNAINFNDLQSVSATFSKLTPLETSLFNNMQTRYLSNVWKGSIQYQHYVTAKKNLSKIHFVGITEAFDESVLKFAQHAQMDLSDYATTKVNVNRYKDGLNPENKELAMILKPLTEYDDLIYDYGKAIFERA